MDQYRYTGIFKAWSMSLYITMRLMTDWLTSDTIPFFQTIESLCFYYAYTQVPHSFHMIQFYIRYISYLPNKMLSPKKTVDRYNSCLWIYIVWLPWLLRCLFGILDRPYLWFQTFVMQFIIILLLFNVIWNYRQEPFSKSNLQRNRKLKKYL